MRRIALLLPPAAIAVALVAVIAVRAVDDSGNASSGGDQCDVGLGSYQSPLDGELLSRADGRLAATVEGAAAGDLEAARQAFFPFAHALAHQVDTQLRREGERALAKRLCEAVLTLEADFVLLNVDTTRLAEDARTVRLLMAEGGRELGLATEEGEG
jgi:hypothetical protein